MHEELEGEMASALAYGERRLQVHDLFFALEGKVWMLSILTGAMFSLGLPICEHNSTRD